MDGVAGRALAGRRAASPDAALHRRGRAAGRGGRRGRARPGRRADAPSVALAGVGRFEQRGRTDTLWAGVDAARRAGRAPPQGRSRAASAPGCRPNVAPISRTSRSRRLPRSAGAGLAIERWLATHAGLASAPFALPHLVLYESHLGRDGATYEPVAALAARNPSRGDGFAHEINRERRHADCDTGTARRGDDRAGRLREDRHGHRHAGGRRRSARPRRCRPRPAPMSAAPPRPKSRAASASRSTPRRCRPARTARTSTWSAAATRPTSRPRAATGTRPR